MITFRKKRTPNAWIKHKLSKRRLRWYEKQIEIALNDNNIEHAEKLIEETLTSKYKNIRSLGRSKAVVTQLERQAEILSLSTADRIPLWWSPTPYPGNLGDSINPLLIQELTGTPPKRSSHQEGAMLCIGSIAHLANKGAPIWGSGFIKKTDAVEILANYHAVRGPLSRELIIHAGGQCPETYGDPAILTPLFLHPKTNNEGRIGVISHYMHEKHLKQGDALFIDIHRASRKDFQEFVNDISRCEYIFSSSLHGLILARAYGIPARRFFVRNAPLSGDDIKFLDYRLGIGANAVHSPLDLEDITNLDESTLKKYRINDDPVTIDITRLLEAFPYANKLLDQYTKSNIRVLA